MSKSLRAVLDSKLTGPVRNGDAPLALAAVDGRKVTPDPPQRIGVLLPFAPFQTRRRTQRTFSSTRSHRQPSRAITDATCFCTQGPFEHAQKPSLSPSHHKACSAGSQQPRASTINTPNCHLQSQSGPYAIRRVALSIFSQPLVCVELVTTEEPPAPPITGSRSSLALVAWGCVHPACRNEHCYPLWCYLPASRPRRHLPEQKTDACSRKEELRPTFIPSACQHRRRSHLPRLCHLLFRVLSFSTSTPSALRLLVIMSSRPRRSAAQKASVAITDMADRDNMSSSRPRRANDGKGFASVSRSGQGEKDHTYLTVKLPANKLRQATTSKQSSSIAVDSSSKRPSRGNKKSYVVDDSESDAEDDEGEDEIQVSEGKMTTCD